MLNFSSWAYVKQHKEIKKIRDKYNLFIIVFLWLQRSSPQS
jgi:hypothetical protein